MNTKKKILEVVKKIASARKEKEINQIDGYDKEQKIRKLTDKMVEYYAELENKQNTPITRTILEKNGFEVRCGRNNSRCYVWVLRGHSNVWLYEYVFDEEYIAIGMVKPGGFCQYFQNHRVDLKTAADLEDTLELCGIDKEIEV